MTYSVSRAAASLLIIVASTAQAETYDIDCVVRPNKETRVSSEVSGVLKSLKVNLGDQVTKGQELARLNTALISARIERSKVDLAFNAREMERARSAGEGVSPAELDEFSTNWARSKAEINELTAELQQLIITAPHSGIVTEILINEGEQVSESHIIKLTQVYPLEIGLNVPYDYRANFSIDRPLTIYQGDRHAETTIDFIEPTLDMASQTFRVKASLDNLKAPDWLAGAGCEVER